jgi:predicted 3'-5' exonuclease similar to PolB exonuclease domain
MQATHTVSQQSPRRIAILDIETVPLDPADSKGALDAITGRIVCAGMLFDDGERLTPNPICEINERTLLERFWAALRPDDLLVGHNILGFDLMFIRQRSWILGVKPPIALNLRKYYTDQVVDLMEMWTNWSSRFKGCGLDNIAGALGVGGKTGHGTDVAGWWAARDYNSIVKYCMDDVYLAYHVYCKMHYREPVGAIPVAAPTSVPSTRVEIPQRELVPVPAGRPAGAALVIEGSLFAPAPASVPVASATIVATTRKSSASRSRRRKETAEILCVRQNGSLILSGATFSIKDNLKDLGARGNKNADNSYEWHLPAQQYEAVAVLCAERGIRLLATANGGVAASLPAA